MVALGSVLVLASILTVLALSKDSTDLVEQQLRAAYEASQLDRYVEGSVGFEPARPAEGPDQLATPARLTAEGTVPGTPTEATQELMGPTWDPSSQIAAEVSEAFACIHQIDTREPSVWECQGSFAYPEDRGTAESEVYVLIELTADQDTTPPARTIVKYSVSWNAFS
jgi:hypothetical protein